MGQGCTISWLLSSRMLEALARIVRQEKKLKEYE